MDYALNPEDDLVDLTKSAKAGDRKAQLEIIRRFRPLVKRFIRRFSRGQDQRDLMQLGTIGILNAIHAWDETFPGDIRNIIECYIKDEIYTGVRAHEAVSGIQLRVLSKYYTLIKTMPENEAIALTAKAMRKSEKIVRRQIECSKTKAISIDAFDEFHLVDPAILADEIVINADLLKKVKKAMESLPEGNKKDLFLHWLADTDENYQAIAKQHDISRSYMSAVVKQIAEKLRKKIALGII